MNTANLKIAMASDRCPKCGGWWVDRSGRHWGKWDESWHCGKCGEIADKKVYRNRAKEDRVKGWVWHKGAAKRNG